MESKHLTKDLTEAIDVFLTELPDPRSSDASTITDLFIVRGVEVKLKAQKVKASGGMTWKIEYYN
jgi:hypothetical protein